MTKLEYFKKFNTEFCKHHGEHSDWKILSNNRKSLECKKCLRSRVYKSLNKNPKYQTEYRYTKKGIITRLLSQARSRSKKYGLDFDLDKDWVFEKLVEQDNKCFYSGVSFSFNDKISGSKRLYIPSIDQIRPKMGYTKSNSVLVLSSVNVMKQDLPLNVFLEICNCISSKNLVRDSI